MQADVSLVGWAAPSAVMTERAPSGPSIDAAADDLVLVEAALAGSRRGLRRRWSRATGAVSTRSATAS